MYLKGGSIIPVAPPYQHVNEANPTDDLSLLVALDEHGNLSALDLLIWENMYSINHIFWLNMYPVVHLLHPLFNMSSMKSLLCYRT